MELFITALIKELIFPPGILLVLLAFGLLCYQRAPKLTKPLLWGTLALGYTLSTPLLANLLHNSLIDYPPLTVKAQQNPKIDAIVVLSSDRYMDAPEYQGNTVVGESTLPRLRYGAYLHRQTGLPIIVSGGRVFEDKNSSLAQTMADSLRNDFNIDHVLLEDQSRSTYENAYYTKRLLDQHNMEQIFLVTNSYHMTRAMMTFQQQGITTIAAPTIFPRKNQPWFRQLFPSASALQNTRISLHEWLGIIWYKIRHF